MVQIVRCHDCYGLYREQEFNGGSKCRTCREWERKHSPPPPPVPALPALAESGLIRRRQIQTDGYVYVIHDGRFTKVGVTTDLRSRYGAIKCHNPTAELIWYMPTPRAYLYERRAHFRLKKHHVHGEWFSVPPEDAIDAVCAVTEGTGAYADKNDPSLWPPRIVVIAKFELVSRTCDDKADRAVKSA